MRTMLIAIVLALACGCEGKAKPAAAPATTTSPGALRDAATTTAVLGDAASIAVVRAVDPAATLETTAHEVTFTVGARTVPGTIIAPTMPGRWPAMVVLAGSGPTDRDWNNPLIKSQNGSGKLLAQAISRRGVVVLRFDKAATGGNPGPALDEFTIDVYRDEARAAVALLSTRADVRADKIFVAGHSEGGMHATRLARVAGPQLAGVLFLSSLSRSLAQTILTQLEHQLHDPRAGLPAAQLKAELDKIRKAFADFQAGRPVDPKQASGFEPIQQLVAGLVAPAAAKLTRPMFSFDTATEAAGIELPMFVLGGGKDVQIDLDLDVRRLELALRAKQRDVTVHVAPDADHVLKHEPRTVAELRADLDAVQRDYNADGRALDPGVITAVVAWLAEQTK